MKLYYIFKNEQKARARERIQLFPRWRVPWVTRRCNIVIIYKAPDGQIIYIIIYILYTP